MLILLALVLIPAINISRASPTPAPGSALDELELSEEIKEELRNILQLSKQISVDQDAEDFDYETARQTLGGLEQCETTGFETRTREECEEVSETECKPITLTKYRTEIVNKCEVKTDKKCDVTFNGVPRQKCVPKSVTKCDIDFEIVEESVFEEQCHVHVQHLCEEYVPVPVHVPAPIVDKHDDYPIYPDKVVLSQITKPEPLFSVPGVRPGQIKVKREAGEDVELQAQVEDIVREMLMKAKLAKAMEKAVKSLKTQFKTSVGSKGDKESINILADTSLVRDPSLLGAPLFLPITIDDQFKDHSIGHSGLHHPEVHPLPNLPVSPDLHHVHSHPAHLLSPPPPVATTFELPPQDPGCRSIATKTCEKIPRIITRKVPHEICKKVPDIECFNVIKEVPELECVPEPYQECNDVAKKIPYLEPAEECEEIFYDDCIEIFEKIPIELCKRKRLDEETVFLEKGKVFRKEGEKRRKKIGNRAAAEERDKVKKRKKGGEKENSAQEGPPTNANAR